jgi:hypothetical protein
VFEIALSIPAAIAYPPSSGSEVRAVRFESRSAGRPRSAKQQNGRA